MPAAERYGESVARLFTPRSVAIVGASQNGRGRTVVDNFTAVGFGGQVVCVNPRYHEVLGFPCVQSLDDVPFDPDVVVLAVSRERVVPLLESAACRNARGAVVFAYGFAETDETGRDLERRLLDIARAADMAVVGPNCQGLINFVEPVPLYMDSVQPYKAGRVALLAESGSVVTSLINNRRGVRWSHAVSSGNEAVTDAADFVRYFVDNGDVSVVCAYLETIRRPEVFFAECDRAQDAGKPIVICKSGRTVEAQAVAAAHSGALALPQRLLDAALRRHGVVSVESLDELLETANAMQAPRAPKGRRLGVLTASGGHIELVHDNLVGTGLEIPEFSAETTDALTTVIGPLLAARNPLDWWGTADPDESLPAILRLVAAAPEIDIVLQVGDFTVGPTGDESRAADLLASARKVQSECEELFVVLDGVGGAPTGSDVEAAVDDGILVLSGFGSGLRALGHLVTVAGGLTSPRPARPIPSLQSSWQSFDREVVAGPEALDLLEIAGLDVVRRHHVFSVQEAVAAAEVLGYPVVAKVAGHDVAHKTELGGVILAISTLDQLAAAADKLLRAGGGGGILVEEQVEGGVEILLGVETTPPLGTFVMVGLGGVWTELIDDVQIRPAGLRVGEAAEMFRSLRGFPRLVGARGQGAVDFEAVVAALERLDDVTLQLGAGLSSLDINPLLALEDRAVVVDALLIKSQ